MADLHHTAILLLGPTGSGKSSLAYHLASSLDAEIINADSVQVYKGLDKATAKPPVAMRQAIPHHLIDILDPATSYCAASFVGDANQAYQRIREKNKPVVVAGGTMFYIYALLNGLSDLPIADDEIRHKYRALAAQQGSQALHRMLKELDEEAAKRIHPQDSQRLLRALEVIEQSGELFSQLQSRPRQGGISDTLTKHGDRLRTFILLFDDRQLLYRKLAQRFWTFIEDGLIDEVRQLKQRPDLSLECPSIRSVGYRQVWEYLDGAYSHDEMLERAIAATRQLAKNQLVWLRSWQQPYDILDATLPTDRLVDHILSQAA